MAQTMKTIAKALSRMQDRLRQEMESEARGNRKSDIAETIGLLVKAEAHLLEMHGR